MAWQRCKSSFNISALPTFLHGLMGRPYFCFMANYDAVHRKVELERGEIGRVTDTYQTMINMGVVARTASREISTQRQLTTKTETLLRKTFQMI